MWRTQPRESHGNVALIFRGLEFLANRAPLGRAEGRLEDALADGAAAVDVARTFGIVSQASKQGLVEALEAAIASDARTRSRTC